MSVCIDISQFKKDYFNQHAIKDEFGNRGLEFEAAQREPEGVKSGILQYLNDGAIIRNVLLIMIHCDDWDDVSPLCYELTKEVLLKLKQGSALGYGEERWAQFMKDVDEILTMLEDSDEYAYTIDWA